MSVLRESRGYDGEDVAAAVQRRAADIVATAVDRLRPADRTVAAKIVAAQFVDRYEEALKALIAEKEKGQKPVAAQPPEDTNVVDLMAALKNWGALTDDYAYAKGLDASNRRGFDVDPGGGKLRRVQVVERAQTGDVAGRLARDQEPGEAIGLRTVDGCRRRPAEAWAQLERGARPSADARPRLLAEFGGHLHVLDATRVEMLEADRNYVVIRVGRDNFHARSTLLQAEQALRSQPMLRISRSCLVNMNYVREVNRTLRGDFILVLAGGATVTSSEGFRGKVKEYLSTLRISPAS